MDHHGDPSEHEPQPGDGHDRPEPDQHDPATEEDTASGGPAQEPGSA
jgi:hypothetical protein